MKELVLSPAALTERLSAAHSRTARRISKRIEDRALSSRVWPPWEHHTFAKGSVGSSGWCAQIGEGYGNGLYAVLMRLLDGDRSGRVHLAIRTPSNLEPSWRDLQRIKNELFGRERFAVQVCPPDSRLIDEADMYHLWIMAEGYEPGFGLHPDD